MVIDLVRLENRVQSSDNCEVDFWFSTIPNMQIYAQEVEIDDKNPSEKREVFLNAINIFKNYRVLPFPNSRIRDWAEQIVRDLDHIIRLKISC